jgi:SAM-dependent methyltransferase
LLGGVANHEVLMPESPYYRADLARIHHEGFGFHADAVAPGVLHLLAPVLERDGLVLEIGCGSGLLTKHLVDAGHRVLATDASPAMLELAREHAPGVAALEPLRLPVDPVPQADAIVSVGHPLSYLDTEGEVRAAVTAMATALRPKGVVAFDICDLEWGSARRDQAPAVWFGDDWVLITRTSLPDPRTFRRDMTMFVREPDDRWRCEVEVHDNVLLETAELPDVLAAAGVDAEVLPSFGDETLPRGLVAVVGRRAS